MTACIEGPISALSSGPHSRRLAAARDWSVAEYLCRAGPDDRPFEEQHEAVSIAVVVEGTFTYTSDSGRALLHQGALLFGNHGACYECRHDHSVGDRCISLQISPDYFEELAATSAGSSRFRFPVPMASASREILPATLLLEALTCSQEPLLLEEELASFVASAVRALSGGGHGAQQASPRDERRISRALRYIEHHSDQAVELDQLAQVAAMSKFHFLRVFRRTLGMTPYQYLLGIRLRRTACRLLGSTEAISKIAFDTGFGDLSTFNRTFRSAFGVSPNGFRQRGCAL